MRIIIEPLLFQEGLPVFTLMLIIIILVLGGIVFYMHTNVVISNRQKYEQSKEIVKERDATAAILGLAQKAISTDISDESFLTVFVEYAQRTLRARGGAVLTVEEAESLKGCAVAGIFPPIRDVPHQVEQQLLAHSGKHTEFFREIRIPNGLEIFNSYISKENGFALFQNSQPDIFPKNFGKLAPRTIIAPINVKGKIFAFVVVVSGEDFDEHKISEEDGKYLVRLNEIASLSIEGVRVFRERRDYEKQVQTAKEEGMLQVSAGIIHNIGNAVTVAKLTVLEMKEKCPEEMNETPESFLLSEILPAIERKVTEGNVQEFLSKDKIGSQFIPISKELLGNISKRSHEMVSHIKSLSEKLYHISEIIELQQRFVGELGTENIVSVSQVVESSIKIFEETFNKYNVNIGIHAEDGLPKVLIDTSMITQVFINLVKNAVESMQIQNIDREKCIDIYVYPETLDGKNYVATKVQDNGPGIDPEVLNRLFQFGFSTKEKKKHSRGYGLHSCMETVKKYGGTIKVESKKGEGSSFIVLLPAGEKR